MDVGTGGNIGEEVVRHGNGKGVAHCIDEDVGNNEVQGIPANDQAADALAEESEVGPVLSKGEVAGTEVEEGETRGVEGDVEAVLDVCDDGVLVDVVVASVDYAESFGVAFLGCADGCPEDSFSTSSCIAMTLVSVLSQGHGRCWYQKGWKKPIMPSHSCAGFPL